MKMEGTVNFVKYYIFYIAKHFFLNSKVNSLNYLCNSLHKNEEAYCKYFPHKSRYLLSILFSKKSGPQTLVSGDISSSYRKLKWMCAKKGQFHEKELRPRITDQNTTKVLFKNFVIASRKDTIF
jgi:hypothetical protein